MMGVLVLVEFLDVGVDDEEETGGEGDAGRRLGEGVADATRLAEAEGFVVEGVVETVSGDVGGVSGEREEGEEVADVADNG